MTIYWVALVGSEEIYVRASSIGREYESDRGEGELTQLCGLA